MYRVQELSPVMELSHLQVSLWNVFHASVLGINPEVKVQPLVDVQDHCNRQEDDRQKREYSKFTSFFGQHQIWVSWRVRPAVNPQKAPQEESKATQQRQTQEQKHHRNNFLLRPNKLHCLYFSDHNPNEGNGTEDAQENIANIVEAQLGRNRLLLSRVH